MGFHCRHFRFLLPFAFIFLQINFKRLAFGLTSTSDHPLTTICRASGSDSEEQPPLELIMIDSLKTRNTHLEVELVAALKLASENLDKAIEAREQVVNVGDVVKNMFSFNS